MFFSRYIGVFDWWIENSIKANPPSVEKIFDSASGPIFHLEWSVNNELMITVSQASFSN